MALTLAKSSRARYSHVSKFLRLAARVGRVEFDGLELPTAGEKP
jgi:hypothetical protein